MEQLQHFSHEHPLNLVQLQPHHDNENSDKEDEDENEFNDDIVVEEGHVGICNMCQEEINSFHLCYYCCKECDYFLHKFCAQLPITNQNHSLHPDHNLELYGPENGLRRWRSGFGKTYKNFKDNDHPNLIRCPFPDESVNLLMHHFINKGELAIKRKIDGDIFCHPHPLILGDTLNELVSLQNPMNREDILCDGCVRPITNVPFYKCSQHHCDFVLHEWCTRLPSKIQDRHSHPEHTLVLLPKIPGKLLGVFWCAICSTPSNGFAYGCKQCEYYVDINCGCTPDVITHEAHPNHLLLRCFAPADESKRTCKACKRYFRDLVGFRCPDCDFFLHAYCALLLPRTIRHKYDKHLLSLRYYPAENHSSIYFCEICEDELNPTDWFYHCSTCATSMHSACALLKLQCEQSTYSRHRTSYLCVYQCQVWKNT
ncbi:uncharacterized protein LOC143572994 [Bidens hawaiensis]|uniref:uncharacterized protein LOC143572994 n=1 Tax=Bidens hawaiensis TaxID=980011 RepID=UPI00404B047B